jgi:hypothetical protein
MMVGIGPRQPDLLPHKSSLKSYLTFPKSRKFIAYGSITGGPLLINGVPSDILYHRTVDCVH